MPNQFVITIVNPKGGTGKSTTCFHFSLSLSKKGKTLVTDMDMQGDISDAFFPDTPIEEFDKANTFTVIRGETTLKDSIKTAQGVDVLVASLEMENFGFHSFTNQALIPKLGFILRKTDYDFIVIDTPGSGAPETVSSIMASDYVLIPVKASKWSTRTIKKVLKKVNEAQTFLNLMNSGRTIQTFILPVQWGRRTNPSLKSVDILEQLKNYDKILSKLKAKEEGFDLVLNPIIADPIPFIQEMDDRTESGEPFRADTIGSMHFENLTNFIIQEHNKINKKKDSRVS
ncbi:ParA family protein [Leptospira ellisii]|uniref:ParA family protein n=3 Tax=Leptospira ellisii TaxID=2023197 RepID=A0AAE4QSV5_9LEPT|nr:ParA family protein [Leptospira ellisii]MDV6237600.1 ParA family protein [Leptospira ellisii]PKA03698.1 chromosome partitioning protein ParA [Leptospira ellisii]